MKSLILASLFFLLPLSAFDIPEKKEQRETLGESLIFFAMNMGKKVVLLDF